MGLALKEARGKPIRMKIACTNGCRHGEPWPTLRLLPSDVKRNREAYGS